MDKKYIKISTGTKGTITEYNVLEYLDKKGVLASTDILPAVTTEGLLSLVHIIDNGLVSPRQSKEVLARMVQDKEMDATKAAHNLGYGGKDTCGDLEAVIDNVVDECSGGLLDEWLNELLDKLVAKVMSRCTIKPNPICLKSIIADKLGLTFDSADCKPLSEYLVDINVVDTANLNTKLLEAAEEGDTDLVRSLIKQGADVNAKDALHYTPLHNAAQYGLAETCKLLLDNGADVNAKSTHGDTPLHEAAWRGHPVTCKVLLEHGAYINVPNTIGKTPLHMAAYLGHTRTCAMLLARGADVNAKDNDGYTPLRWANQYGYEETSNLLRQYIKLSNTSTIETQ